MAQGTPHEVAQVLDELVRNWRRVTPDSSLSRTAAYSLGALYRAGPMRLTTLAADQAVSQPAMTGLIGRLEKQGLVTRGPDACDGRAVIVGLTTKGSALIQDRKEFILNEFETRLTSLDSGHINDLVRAIPALRRLTREEAP